MVVALLCLVAGIVAENGVVFVSLGGFWFIMAIVVRGKNVKKPPETSYDGRATTGSAHGLSLNETKPNLFFLIHLRHRVKDETG